jgi:hypothetical protein
MRFEAVDRLLLAGVLDAEVDFDFLSGGALGFAGSLVSFGCSLRASSSAFFFASSIWRRSSAKVVTL